MLIPKSDTAVKQNIDASIEAAATKNKPQVVHQSDINTELLPQDIYSGMYARVKANHLQAMCPPPLTLQVLARHLLP